MNADEAAKELRQLAKDAGYIWSQANDIINKMETNGNGIFFDFPVKSPMLEMYDSLNGLANHYEQNPPSVHCCGAQGFDEMKGDSCSKCEEGRIEREGS